MRRRYRLLTLAVLIPLALQPVAGQEPARLDLGGQFIANGEAERYARLLQLVGKVPAYPVSSRPWSRHEAGTLLPTGDHPWASRFQVHDTSGAVAPLIRVLRPNAAATFNTAAPVSEAEGPVWAGKGATIHATIGARVTFGMLDVQLAPVAFWAQNAAFDLAPNGQLEAWKFREPRYPNGVDAPQRFGDGSYTRIDAGYSRASIDSRFLSGGVATMPLAWGPARDEPLVLGPSAGGFVHGYLGTGEPLPVLIGKLHLKLIAGRLEQSDWSPVEEGDRSRFATAAVVLLTPRGIPGLEIGASRFEHRIWTPGVLTLGNVLRPFTSVINDNVTGINSGDENGYASAFFRWAAAPHGFEVYGEYGREDYTGSLRWLLQKPDDFGSLLFGFQRVFAAGANGMKVVRGEWINAETSSNEVGQRGRRLFPPYFHGGVNQGHTNRGQILGSPTAFGGAGWSLAFDQYGRTGRTSWTFNRRLLRDWQETPATPGRPAPEVSYGLRVEQLRAIRGGGSDITLGAGVTGVLNEHTVSGRDRIRAQLHLGWRGF